MTFKFLLFSILYSTAVYCDVFYDTCGRPDYEKINESMKQEQLERDWRHTA